MSETPPVLHRPDGPLSDAVVTLDAFTTDDVLAVVAAVDDEILRWLPLPDPYGETEARAFISAPINTAASGDALNWAIRLVGSDGGSRLAGSIGVSVSRPRKHEVELGYWVAPDARRRGTACRAVRLLAGHVFTSPEIARVEILTHPANRASRRVAERAGARFEGVRRGGLVPPARDGTTDAAVYALLRGDVLHEFEAAGLEPDAR